MQFPSLISCGDSVKSFSCGQPKTIKQRLIRDQSELVDEISNLTLVDSRKMYTQSKIHNIQYQLLYGHTLRQKLSFMISSITVFLKTNYKTTENHILFKLKYTYNKISYTRKTTLQQLLNLPVKITSCQVHFELIACLSRMLLYFLYAHLIIAK